MQVHMHFYSKWFREHTEAWTKLSIFCRWHFQMHLFNQKHCILIQTSLNFVPKIPANDTSTRGGQAISWAHVHQTPYDVTWGSMIEILIEEIK